MSRRSQRSNWRSSDQNSKIIGGAMASKQVVVVVVFAVVVVAFAPPALAADIIVGGEHGWGLGFDYDKWADGNDFIVGDTLVFKYAMGKHTVVEATAEDFDVCSQDSSLRSWSSGEDRVPLGTAGPRWFFCGVGDHCAQQGMKLNITVLPIVKLSASGPSSSSSSSPPSSSPAPRTPGGGIVAALATGVGVAAAALVF